MITQFTLKDGWTDGTAFILVLWRGHCIQPTTAVLRYLGVSDNLSNSLIDNGFSQEVTHSTTKPVEQYYMTQQINLSND